MTQPAHQHLFAPRTLSEVQNEVLEELTRLKAEHPARYLEAYELCKAQPQSRRELAAAEKLLEAVLGLSRPTQPAEDPMLADLFGNMVEEDLPATMPPPSIPLLPPAPSAAVTPPAPLETPAAEDEAPGEDSGDNAEGEASEDEQDDPPGEEPDEATDEAQSSNAPDDTAVPVLLPMDTTVRWPEGTLGTGLISQLAATLNAGDLLTFAVLRRKDGLLITVQPKPLAHEPEGLTLPLQISGSPISLDTELAHALSGFVAGRQIARDVASEYELSVKKAAEVSRKASEKAKAKPTPTTTTSAKPNATNGSVELTVTPKDALLVLTNTSTNATLPVKAGLNTLPAGSYRLNVDAQDYDSAEITFTVKTGGKEKKAIVLKKTGQTGLLSGLL